MIFENGTVIKKSGNKFKIKLERTQSNISLAQMSELTTITKTKLRDYEAGKRSIPLPDLEMIIEVPNEDQYEGRLRRW